MNWQVALQIVGGLVGLVLGGEFLVRGASRIAARVGVSPLVIGLTIVAFGTSAPELVVSIQAGLAGSSGIALANVVGSNIFNVLFILGLCALVAPLSVSSQLVRLDVPILVLASLAIWLFARDASLGWIEGSFLVASVVAYTIFIVRKSRQESREIQQEFAQEYAPKETPSLGHLFANLGFVAGGLVVLVFGADWLVAGATSLAKSLGVSDTVIGLTIVAGGTSLPEVATSVVATAKGERDIAVGNVVGSGIYNLLLILGAASLVTPGGLVVDPVMLGFDIPIMTLVAALCLPIFVTGSRISRAEGLFLFAGYGAYLVYILDRAVQTAR